MTLEQKKDSTIMEIDFKSKVNDFKKDEINKINLEIKELIKEEPNVKIQSKKKKKKKKKNNKKSFKSLMKSLTKSSLTKEQRVQKQKEKIDNILVNANFCKVVKI